VDIERHGMLKKRKKLGDRENLSWRFSPLSTASVTTPPQNLFVYQKCGCGFGKPRG
jgi:hypothetical protein